MTLSQKYADFINMKGFSNILANWFVGLPWQGFGWKKLTADQITLTITMCRAYFYLSKYQQTQYIIITSKHEYKQWQLIKQIEISDLTYCMAC